METRVGLGHSHINEKLTLDYPVNSIPLRGPVMIDFDVDVIADLGPALASEAAGRLLVHPDLLGLMRQKDVLRANGIQELAHLLVVGPAITRHDLERPTIIGVKHILGQLRGAVDDNRPAFRVRHLGPGKGDFLDAVAMPAIKGTGKGRRLRRAEFRTLAAPAEIIHHGEPHGVADADQFHIGDQELLAELLSGLPDRKLRLAVEGDDADWRGERAGETALASARVPVTGNSQPFVAVKGTL